MPSLISHLSQVEQKRLLDDLNYLNIEEYQAFCKKHSIPFAIFVETVDGKRKKTADKDRKGVVLNRIRHYLLKGKILGPTCYSRKVVNTSKKLSNPAFNDRLHYGQYDKTNQKLMRLLESLTDGQFRHGAIARILARDFWTRGTAPTLKEFARAWIKASRDHTKPRPEWAFLSDRAGGTADRDWKLLRAEKARDAGFILKNIKHSLSK